MRTARSILAIALLAAGCQTLAPTGALSGSRRVFTPHVAATTAPTLAPTNPPAVLPPADPTRIVDAGTAADLIGKVKLISDKGLGLIDASTLISDKGLGIVSNNSAGIISGNSGNYRVLATAPTESLLANATIEVLDGDGKLLVGKDGTPISAKTDASGNYTLNATLPDENLWLRVSLPDGDQLSALLVRDGSGQQTIDIDTASTLGATYVLNQYVKDSKTVYARLPATDAQKLLADTQAAEPLLTTLPSYKPADVVAATDALRTKSTALDSELTHIKDILLLGQQDLGSGLKATAVPLTGPTSLYRDGAGDVYIAEALGRIRKVDPSGQISLYAGLGNGSKTVQGTLGLLADMIGKPDGTLYLAAYADNLVRMISPDGQLSTIAGGGTDTSGNGKATDEKLNTVHRLALGPDGSLYILEKSYPTTSSRILKVDTSGNMTLLPPFTTDNSIANGFGLAATSDGTLYAVRSVGAPGMNQAIVALAPGATSWKTVCTGVECAENEYLRVGADGALYLPSEFENTVYRVDPKSAAPQLQAVIQGDGGTLDNPRDVVEASGTALVLCAGSATVYQVPASGTPQRFAGQEGIAQLGNALGLALNAPGGLCVDDKGNFVFSEDGSNTVKRLNGTQLELVAGGTRGDADGKGASAQLDGPGGLAEYNGTIYELDSGNYQVRAIAPDGTVTTVAGNGERGGITQTLTPASQATFGKLAGVAIDSQGRVWFSDVSNHQILRLNADGNVELIAGAPVVNGLGTHDYKGDGGPASQALLNSPCGLAFDKAGNLYFADAGNFCIRKIDTQGNISTVAGVTGSAAQLRLVSGQVDTGDVAADQALFVGPASLCMDANDNLYITELGSGFLTTAVGLAEGGVALGFTLPDIPARVRMLSADRKTVSIVVGPGGKALTDATSDTALLSPIGLAIDGTGRLAIADATVDQIKILPAGSY